MTKAKTIDNREYTYPTFEDLNEGDMFTQQDYCEGLIFIKTPILHNDAMTTSYNAIDFEGELCWMNDDDEVQLINEIDIIIKK